jgi:hypothetical protein
MMGFAVEQISIIAFFGLGSPGVGEMVVIGVGALVFSIDWLSSHKW